MYDFRGVSPKWVLTPLRKIRKSKWMFFQNSFSELCIIKKFEFRIVTFILNQSISRKWRFYFTFEASFFFSNEGTRAFNLRNSLFLAYLRYFLTTFCPANNVRSNCLRWLLDRGGVLNSYLDGLRILNFIRFKLKIRLTAWSWWASQFVSWWTKDIKFY